eukprot:1314070-Rhodomonas_salina.1
MAHDDAVALSDVLLLRCSVHPTQARTLQNFDDHDRASCGQAILLNLYIAVIVENFSLASLKMSDADVSGSSPWDHDPIHQLAVLS